MLGAGASPEAAGTRSGSEPGSRGRDSHEYSSSRNDFDGGKRAREWQGHVMTGIAPPDDGDRAT